VERGPPDSLYGPLVVADGAGAAVVGDHSALARCTIAGAPGPRPNQRPHQPATWIFGNKHAGHPGHTYRYSRISPMAFSRVRVLYG